MIELTHLQGGRGVKKREVISDNTTIV